MPRLIEKKDYMNLTWLNYQYYVLGKSLQDIADDQGVSMMRINKWVDKIDESRLVKTEEKSANFCPHCGQNLPPKAIFCIMCGKKVQKDQVIPSVSGKKEDTLVSDIPQIKAEELQPIPSISDTWKKKMLSKTPDLGVEKIQTVPLIKDEKKQKQVTEDFPTEIEEKQPVLPVPDTKVDILERLKEIPPICKFCRMDLNEKATFCPQCGTKVKKK